MTRPSRPARALGLLTVVATLAVVGGAAAPLHSRTARRAVPTVSGARAELTAALRRSLHTRHPSAGRRAPGRVPRAADGLTQVKYFNWAGYANDHTTGKTYDLVSASWTEPTVACPKDEDRMALFWVGLDGFSSPTVEQAGSGVFCSEGTALHFTWWEMYPSNAVQITATSVAPGDRISASVGFASGTYTLTVTDRTAPANSFTKTAACASDQTCANSSAEWIAETPGALRGQEPWPNFHTWKLTNARVRAGSATGVISAFPSNEITLIGSAGRSLATTNPLANGDQNFSVKWIYAWQ